MIIIGSDHCGIEFKKEIIKILLKNNIKFEDATDFENQEGDDYPDIANIICSKVLANKENLGIAICGTGIGISISCNKIKNIRAALCTDVYMSEMARKHNNANVLCIGARLEGSKKLDNIENMINSFINTNFEGGRHDIRIKKINKLENNDFEGGINNGICI